MTTLPRPEHKIADCPLPIADFTSNASNGQRTASNALNQNPESRTQIQPVPEVLELTSENPDAVLAAVLRRIWSDCTECPVRPPMCPQARLTVARSRSLELWAVVKPGLEDLGAIGRSMQWVIENQFLIAMAMPQFAIDRDHPPQLHLLVDQADLSAELLQAMVQGGHTTIHTYRRVRWGDRLGLLLEDSPSHLSQAA